MSEARAMEQRLVRANRQQAALLDLSTVQSESFDERLRRLLKTTAETLDVARTSYWSLVEEPVSIRCDALYIRDADTVDAGTVLTERDFPHYFQALRLGTTIIADDAHTNESTREFSEDYLKPLGITSMLDIPVYVRGQLVGVVCNEHVGTARSWATDELLFCMSVGQFVSLALETRSREAVEEALRESEARFRSIVEASPIPMIVSSFPEGDLLYANSAAGHLMGKDTTALAGENTSSYYANPQERDGLIAYLASGKSLQGREVQLKRTDGTSFWALLSVEQMLFGGRPAMVAGIWDLTRQKELEEYLRHAALHDPLTGLANRTMFVDLLRNEIARAARDPAYRFAVLYIDLDGFKQVNDALGHKKGDELLVQIASRLNGCLRATDTAARIGGDEFTALLVGFNDTAEIQSLVVRVNDAMRVNFDHGDQKYTVSASIGVIVADSSYKKPDEILLRADEAMYVVKHSTRPPRPARVVAD